MNSIEELLLSVQKPGRYVGGEWNSVKKEWAENRLKVLVAFPDVYEVGSSHLGLKILYGILNDREDCLCERVFAPWPDFEDILRKNNLSLFSLESRRPIRQFDIIGFSLGHELCYTNIINIMDLAGIPAKSSERRDEDPLIIAGGPCSYNPEPIAEFIDAFVIGDGEEAVLEIVEAYGKSKVKSQKSKVQEESQNLKKELLRELAKIRGVYVPALYNVEYNDDRTIKSFAPVETGVPGIVEKRTVVDLDGSYYPVNQIVPNIQIVHDRIVLEIMRGCKHACKFCQATSYYRPCRERSISRIVELAKKAYESTGYDEISLLSLSSGDHSRIKQLIEKLNEEFGGKAVSISVPSLRIEDILKGLPALISKVRKSGLTFAPEAGSEKLREAVNKNIDIGRLFDAVEEAFKSGWNRIKLYFMIGLPGESEGDVLEIASMIDAISMAKAKLDGKPAHVAVSINAFIPKPHTGFEREGMDSAESLQRKRSILCEAVKSRKVELDFHSFHMSFVEAALSRGDRMLSAVIYESWKAGARFDSWQEHFNFDIWINSFKKNGIDPSSYVHRKRPPQEKLPWEFIKA